MTWRFYSWPLDREFNFTQWGEYLKEHPDETAETALEYHGFRFNPNGYCLNPHVITIGDKMGRPGNYVDIRTFITPLPPVTKGWKTRKDLPCWNFSIFAINNAANGFGNPFATEDGAIDAALEACAKHLKSKIGWYDQCLKNGNTENMGYEASRKRNADILKLVKQFILDRKQLTLF